MYLGDSLLGSLRRFIVFVSAPLEVLVHCVGLHRTDMESIECCGQGRSRTLQGHSDAAEQLCRQHLVRT